MIRTTEIKIIRPFWLPNQFSIFIQQARFHIFGQFQLYNCWASLKQIPGIWTLRSSVIHTTLEQAELDLGSTNNTVATLRNISRDKNPMMTCVTLEWYNQSYVLIKKFKQEWQTSIKEMNFVLYPHKFTTNRWLLLVNDLLTRLSDYLLCFWTSAGANMNNNKWKKVAKTNLR